MAEKKPQIGVPLEPDRKAAWERLADERFGKRPAVLAREVLEDFLSCYLEGQDLERLKMYKQMVSCGDWLMVALSQKERRHGRTAKRK